MNKIEKEVERLVELKPYSFKKPFKGRIEPLDKSLSKHSTPLTSRGKPWMLKLYAVDAPIPEEMFKVMNLHSEGGKPGFIGWAGGTITPGRVDPKTKKELASMMAVEEVQSDLLQRTVEFQDPERYQRTLRRRMAEHSSEYAEAHRALEALKKEYADLPDMSASDARGAPLLRQRLELEHRIGELETEMEQIFQDWKKEFKYPEFAQYKSKVENYYKRWTDALFNACLKQAQEANVVWLSILTADGVASVWSGRERLLFNRIYDKTAQRWNMTRIKGAGGKDWWVADVSSLSPLESIESGIDKLLEME